MSLTAVTAALVATLVGFTSSIAIIFSAAQGFGADAAQIGSWVWALCIGCAICSIVPSVWLRMPVMIAWSTPGAVVLATAAATGRFGMAEAVGAFIVSAGLITLAGVTRLFERLMNRIPMAVASALLAGVLARFAMQAFAAAGKTPGLVLAMLFAYLLGKRLIPRYAVVLTLIAGVLFALEVIRRRVPWRVLALASAPACVAAFVGDRVCLALGTVHTHYDAGAALPLDGLLIAKWLALAVAAAGCAHGYIWLVETIRRYGAVLPAPVLAALGGAVVVAAVLLVAVLAFVHPSAIGPAGLGWLACAWAARRGPLRELLLVAAAGVAVGVALFANLLQADSAEGLVDSGLRGDHSTLIAKAALDGVTSVVFASALGPGVMLSALPVLVYQGVIALLGNLVAQLLGTNVVQEDASVILTTNLLAMLAELKQQN